MCGMYRKNEKYLRPRSLLVHRLEVRHLLLRLVLVELLLLLDGGAEVRVDLAEHLDHPVLKS